MVTVTRHMPISHNGISTTHRYEVQSLCRSAGVRNASYLTLETLLILERKWVALPGKMESRRVMFTDVNQVQTVAEPKSKACPYLATCLALKEHLLSSATLNDHRC